MTTISTESINFANNATTYHHFADQLNSARFGPLASQEGLTADDLRYAFQRGEQHACEIGEKNEAKMAAYDSAYDSAAGLRSELKTIAQESSSKIKEIQNSKEPVPIKISKISDIILDCHQQASAKTAMCGDSIISATQRILDREGIPTSARQFAKNRGIDTDRMFKPPDKEAVNSQVKKIFGSANQEGFNTNGTGTAESPQQPSDPTPEARPSARPGQLDATTCQTDLSTRADVPVPSGRPGQLDTHTQHAFPPVPKTTIGGTTPSPHLGRLDAAPPTSVPQVPMAGVTPPSAPASGLPSLPALPATGLPQGLTPSGLLQGFDHGMQAGTPMSAATNALAGGPMAAVSSQLPPLTPETSPPVMSTVPASPHVPVYDVPPQGPATVTEAPQIQSHPSTPEANPPYLAVPAGAALATPATGAPTSPLPGYGTDIRGPVAATSAPIAPISAQPTAPASAPASPSSATGGLGQPAVVRQASQPVAPVGAAQTTSGVVERAIAATAGGAVAGVNSADATAQARLQRLVDSVARQEPRLRWAAGQRTDGTTVLVTDLARGWIPPQIAIPVGMQLREPGCRHGDVVALLGDATRTAGYAPGRYLPPTDTAEAVAISARARQVPAAEELGWELNQATTWRDGLPRLARTVAIAASRGTGVLDSEMQLLRAEIGTLSEDVLGSYPDHVDVAAVANWQLLAAIEALADGDESGANYHFAWFQAMSRQPANKTVS